MDNMETEERNELLCNSVETNQDLVQIKTADEKEVQRRINSFIQNKRNEVNERNIREFISPFDSDPNNSCARVEAVYVHREGMKSHINLKRVENVHGPQTRLTSDLNDGLPASANIQRAEAVEERLSNMELHLNTNNNEGDIYKRIKCLEERISFLEAVSPEYFTNGIPPQKRNKSSNLKQEEDCNPMESLKARNVTDINKRIKQLREILKSKSENRPSD